MRRTVAVIISIAMVFSLFACAGASKQQQGTGVGAGVGAAVGAILGQAIGRDTEATLLGAGIGAVVGGIAGNQVGAYMDRQERDLRAAIGASEARTGSAIASAEAASIRRDQDILTATFKSEVFFDYDSATLKPGAYSELSRVANVLNRYPDTLITVEGHTDARGSETYNQQLSERRADAVKATLVQMGVDERRIQAVGYGESQPISSNYDMNRRVNIVITPVVRQG